MRDAALAALCATLICSTSQASVSNGITVTHFETLQALTINKNASGGLQKLQDHRDRQLTFTAFGRNFRLALEPNDRLLSLASRQNLSGDVATYRGAIEGETGSWARIVIADGSPRGLIWDGQEMFALEGPDENAVQSSSAVIYRLADTHMTSGAMSCGATSSGSGDDLLGSLVGELGETMASTASAVSQIELGAVADYEFFTSKGGGSETAVLTRLNNVDGIYSEQLGVHIVIDELRVFTSPLDPFTAATDADTLLEELGNYRVSTPAQYGRGLTHLYTGRDLDTNTVGIAYINQLCHSRYGVGLSQASNNATFDSLVAAHEIGHNFGAPHDGESGSACASERGAFIMSSAINGSDTFSGCSIEKMQPNIAAASCIAPLAVAEVSVASQNAVQSVFLGNAATVEFEVANDGSGAAGSVALEVTLPANVSLDAATTSSGSCTSGAGVVDCALGTIRAGGRRFVTLSLTAVAPGNGEFVATVSADSDDDAGNNEATTQLTVDSAVDLVVHDINEMQLTAGQDEAVSVQLENRSVLSASGVELSVTLEEGLEAKSASWPLGACSVTTQAVNCTSDHFSAKSNAILNLNLRATSSSPSRFDVRLSSTEADANSGDNRATGSTVVSAAPDSATASGANGGSGGGAMGAMSLLLAAWAASRRRILKQRAVNRVNERCRID